MKNFLFFLLMLVSVYAFAGVSKWVDADGKVHYSDQVPPPDVKAKTLRVTSVAVPASAVAASAPAAPKTIAELEAELKKAQLAKKEAADKASQEQSKIEAMKANCETAQQNLQTLQEGLRMVIVNAKGERSYLDDEQRKQRIDKAQQNIKTYCK